MKKYIVCSLIFGLLAAWLIRYYAVNGTFQVHDLHPVEISEMHAPVAFNDYMSYGVQYAPPGYTIAVESARIVPFEDYLQEIGQSAEVFTNPAEQYLELTLTIVNHGDAPDGKNGVSFYGLPLLGTNWYTFYDNEFTSYINPIFEGNSDLAHICAVEKGESATVKVAYNLRKNNFMPDQWEHLSEEEMWLQVTCNPVDQRICIQLSPWANRN